MTSMAQWVTGADTKLGLLAAALTVLTGAILTQERDAWRELTSHPSSAQLVACGFLAVSLIALLLAVLQLVQGLRARVPLGAPNRFSFPHVARMTVAELDVLDPATARHDAWTQAHALANIARCKYQAFNRALARAAIAGISLAVWFVIPPS